MTAPSAPRTSEPPLQVSVGSRPALVLVNLGTPESPTTPHVRSFLKEFLSDRRVIELHPAVWQPVLRGPVLALRPRASAEKYATIWGEGHRSAGSSDGGQDNHDNRSTRRQYVGSPLMHYTRRQAQLLQRALGEGIQVRVAMRYGQPALRRVMGELIEAGCRRIAILPLYPQYAASSCGTVVDEAARFMLASRDQPELRTTRSFPDSPAYIEALAQAVESHWALHGPPDPRAGERMLLSFHSIPQAMHEAGDPYRSQCELTATLLGRRLAASCAMPEGAMELTFQSVFGPAAWIGPATIETVAALGRAGCPRLDIICPGFVSDCLETLEEIDQLNRGAFTESGGGEFHYIPWGNDSPGLIDLLVEQARSALSGWVELPAASPGHQCRTQVLG